MNASTPQRDVTDPGRLAALDALDILDTPAEQGFEDAVRLASRLCAVPVALVSLVGADRQWFKARRNFPPCETDLERSVCRFALGEHDLLVIPDLTLDPRTAANALVTGEPGIRFYAGAPLRLSNGHVVGSLCVIDTLPRPEGLTVEQAEDLRALGRQVVGLLEARRAATEAEAGTVRERAAQVSALAHAEESEAQNVALRASDERGRLAQEAGGVGLFEVDVVTGTMQVTPEFCRLFGVPVAPSYPASALEALVLPEDAAVRSDDRRRREGSASLDVEYRIRRADDGVVRWIARRANFRRDDSGRVIAMSGTARDVTERRAMQDALRSEEALARENADRMQLALAAGAIIGTWVWDIPGDRFAVDEAFARSFGLDPALGREGIPLAQIIATVHPDDQEGLAAAIAEVIARGGAYAHEYRVRRADGRYYWIEANGRVDRASDGTPTRFPGVLLDIEERHAAQLAQRASEARWRALAELGDRLRDLADVPSLVQAAAEVLARITGATRAGYGVVDAVRETVEVLTDWCAPGHVSVAGLHHFRSYGSYIEDLRRGEVVTVADVSVDPRTRDEAEALLAIGVRVLLNVPIVERGRLVGIGFVNYAAPHEFSEDDLTFVRAVVDRVQTAVARVRAEEDQRLLNEEISHRLKNSFAMVLSIAGQTLRGVPDRAPVEAFEQRIHALSSAHDVLLRKSWAAAPAKDVVRAVLAGAGHGDRIDVSGPEIDIGPRATLSLSLLLHELATNAAKYGALSVPEGRVAVAWRLDGEGEDREVEFDWSERGGPPVVPPAPGGRKGFGSRLIGIGLAGSGGVDLRYPPSGFQATMRAPLAHLQNS
ncbi:PAS domain-containing protein [Methylobacterium radiotolerans]|uniref:PAS domain-containing protein n=1 Tax=Methylobacterium radiotolerans TaxID=31998 RepID=UPI001F3463C4|nr:PAS domain-containing protein [Methylobacterium radiotolerans]UIY44235.1 PAS domain-containing protein [Methylobacterium radiotolerans]